MDSPPLAPLPQLRGWSRPGPMPPPSIEGAFPGLLGQKLLERLQKTQGKGRRKGKKNLEHFPCRLHVATKYLSPGRFRYTPLQRTKERHRGSMALTGLMMAADYLFYGTGLPDCCCYLCVRAEALTAFQGRLPRCVRYVPR